MIRLPKFTYLHRQLLVKTTPYKTKLKTAEIDTVIEHYSLEQCHVAGYLEGSSSDNFLLKTDQGNKVLKKYFWSLPSIMQEHSLLRYLNNLGFPTPNLEYSKGLKSTIELNGRCYSIYNFVEGYNILHYYITTKMRRLLVHQAGTILAQLHQVTKNFIPDGYKYNGFKTDGIMLQRDTDWHLDLLKGYLEIIKQRELSDKGHIYLLNIASELQRDLIELSSYFEQPSDQFPRLVIHGDFAPHNLLFYGKQLISILDFGDACLNLKAIDVARGLTTLSQKISAYTGRFHIDPSLAKEFLQTYQDQQPGRLLSAEEIKSVPDLIRWRLIQPFIWRLNRSLAK